MRTLLLSLLALAACSQDNPEACKNDIENCRLVSSENLRQFHDKCKELAQCMKADYEVVSFANQSSNPYTCSITRKGKLRTHNWYLYPAGSISFDRVWFDNFDNAIKVCEMMTDSGEFSEANYKMWEERYKDIERRQKEREAGPPKEPPMKIRVSQ